MKTKVFYLFNYFIIIFFYCSVNTVYSQNTSYNINSIPITGNNNAAFGFQSLFSNTNGSGNMAFGNKSLFSNTSGYLNTSIGNNSLYSNTLGNDNTAVGAGSLFSNINGYRNVAIGSSSLYSNVIGQFNIGVGSSSLYNNTAGVGNTAIGHSSLANNSTGFHNTAIGLTSMNGNTTGSYNCSIGGFSQQSNVTGDNNTTIGFYSDVASGNLTNSTAIGYGSIISESNAIQLGNNNVAKVFVGTGTNATLITGGLQLIGGIISTGKVLTSDAFGFATWQTPTGGGWGLLGNSNTIDGTNFIGTSDNIPLNFRVNNQSAGRIDHIKYNTFYGLEAGRDITTGSGAYNTGSGTFSMQAISTGDYNTAYGGQSLQANSSGSGNTAIGMLTLAFNRTGIQNTANGYTALSNNRNGNYNSAFGTSALTGNSSGNYNTSVGYASMHNNTVGSYNTVLGAYADFSLSTPDLTNATAIGAQAIVNANNKVRIGDVNVTVVEGPVAYTISDGRFKTNINEKDVKGLEFINKLRPVVYNFDTRKFEEFLTKDMADSVRTKIFSEKDFTASTAIRQSGFIAQEVEQAAKEAGYNFNGIHVPESKGDNYSLAYSQFVVPLVKSIQELSAQNENMRKEIEELKKLIGNHSTEENTVVKIGTAKLFQNAPNPFNQSTLIKYLIPSTAKKAVLIITSIDGNKLKEYYLSNKIQTLEVAASQFASGTYVYSLIVDDVLIDSKLMVLTR